MIVDFARSKQGGRKLRTIWRVGKVLCLEAKCALLFISDAAFARLTLQKVARVKLNAGLRAGKLEDSPRLGRNHFGHRYFGGTILRLDAPVVIEPVPTVSCLQIRRRQSNTYG